MFSLDYTIMIYEKDVGFAGSVYGITCATGTNEITFKLVFEQSWKECNLSTHTGFLKSVYTDFPQCVVFWSGISAKAGDYSTLAPQHPSSTQDVRSKHSTLLFRLPIFQ